MRESVHLDSGLRFSMVQTSEEGCSSAVNGPIARVSAGMKQQFIRHLLSAFVHILDQRWDSESNISPQYPYTILPAFVVK